MQREQHATERGMEKISGQKNIFVLRLFFVLFFLIDENAEIK